MKVWLDLANSPHPLLFTPVARRIQAEGHELLVTARDNAQTVELARERWPELEVIGAASPRGKTAKLETIGRRAAGLRRWARASRPHVALSHNSYAQLLAAASLRIPAVTAMDFEYQPANHLAFRLAKTVILPGVIPLRRMRSQGAAPRKVVRYPGLKEELYIGDFEADPRILAKLGLKHRPQTVVIARTPPTRAIYHPSANPLFEDALRVACSQQGVVCIVLTRYPEQVAAIESLELRNCVVPQRAIDSRSLMYVADAMIGAGGTMTREAALMGVPTWTVFPGSLPAVDGWLERKGMLRRLTNAGQLARLGPRKAERRVPAELRKRGDTIARVLVDATLSACDR